MLANLDRVAYAQRPIRGLVLPLDAIAKQGALAREDPNPWPAVAGLPGQSQIAFASNWAGGQHNALLAYYGWMYDDGYGSRNLDCSSPTRCRLLGAPPGRARVRLRARRSAWARLRSCTATRPTR